MKFNKEYAKKFYDFLDHEEGYTELRAFGGEEPRRKYVNNKEDFVEFCEKWSGERDVYAGVNPRKRKGGSNEDVLKIKIIPMDWDAVRVNPKKTPASEEELITAIERVKEIANEIEELGYERPSIDVSGNGCHLLFKIPPINPENYKLEELDERLNEFQRKFIEDFDREGVDADPIGDPARIIRVWGTENLKGKDRDFAEDRPNRLAKPLEINHNVDKKIRNYIFELEIDLSEKEEIEIEEEELDEKTKRKVKKLREKDEKLDKLLNTIDTPSYPSPSEADLAAASKLAHYDFEPSQIAKIIRVYRPRKKVLERGDYLKRTIKKAIKDNSRNPGEKDKEGDREEIETSKVEFEDFLAEQIVTERGPAFAYLNDEEIKIEKEIQMGDEVYVPRNDEAVEKNSVLLPSGIEDYESTKALVEEIRKLIHKYVDVSESYEKLASWYVVTTWVYDELSTLSYLRALGDTGTGKSRLLDVVGRMCYKPIIVSGAVTPAPIYRLMEQWKGTLIIDEGDLRKSDAMNEVVTILNCGFERGRPVIRCTKDNPDDIQFHRTFGPKLIATRQEFNDKALESRCLTEKMTQTSRGDIPDQLPQEFFDKAEEMRNKLLKWRLENKENVSVGRSRNIKIGNIEPRLKQATRGFLAVFKDEEIKRELFNFLEKHQRELIEQRSQTWEGMIINEIYDAWKEDKEKLDEKPKLWPKKIAEKIREDYGDEKITAAHVGKRLRGMDLETKRKRIYVEEEDERKQRRVLVWDEDKLDTLFERYVPGYGDFVTGVTGVTVMTGRTTLEKINKLSSWASNNFNLQDVTASHPMPSHPSQPSQIQQDILDFMDQGMAYSHYDIADEFGFSDREAKGRLESLYENGFLKKGRGKGEDFARYTLDEEADSP